MIRVGVVNIDTSHPNAFSQIMEAGDRARYTAIYNDGFRGEDEVLGFMRSAGIQRRCDTVEELAELVDVGFIQGCDWDKHLLYTEPFIRRSKPVFIDKPIVGSMADVKKLREFANNGAVILGSSCMRYAPEITGFMSVSAGERGEIISVHSLCGVDEFNYAIHAVEAIGGLIEAGAEACAFLGGSEIAGVRGETYAIRYKSGITATYSITYGQWQKSVVTVLTSKRSYVLEPAGYDAMLELVIDSVESGVQRTASVDALTESIIIMLAGRISRSNGGGYVSLCDVPDDYEGFDGAAFEKEYAAAAKKLYI